MEKFYRSPIDNYIGDTLSFQAIEWKDYNENIIDDDTDDNIDQEDEIIDEKYIIRIFGVTREGYSVCVNVENFTPFFFIKVPDNWKNSNVKILLSKICDKLIIKKYNQWVKCDKNLLKSKCIILKKKDFYGFSNNKEFKFLRLVFDNSDAMRRASNIIKNHNLGKSKLTGFSTLPLYESNLDPIIRFAHLRNLNFSGWINIDDFIQTENYNKKSSCQIETTVNWQSISKLENNTNAPILQASYDIETYSEDGSFPSPDKKSNVITQIATAFKFFGSSEFYMKHVICLKKCSDILSTDNVPVFLECYDTEEEVLLAWKKLIENMDPDILYQYNGDRFDGNYLFTRSKLLNCDDEFLQLGKLKNIKSELIMSSFSSSAYGSSNFKRLTFPGRINFDLLIYIKREYKENSYKLDNISEKYLDEKKNPVTPQMMFQYFREGDPDKIKVVAEYCIKDTLLPQKLVDKMHILQNQISMSNVTHVPIRFLIERGQQIKVFSQILKETRKHNYLVPTIDNYSSTEDDEGFEGATVLSPLSGAYFEPVTVCDFASLYPSIIRAHNLCFSTIVLDNNYDNLEGIEYNTVEWSQNNDDNTVTNFKFKYVKNTQGILPKLLEELTSSRKEYKNLMKLHKDDVFLKEVYNKCQLAVKVSMNSIYGFLAAPMLKCKPIAATVTAIGRNMIKDTKQFMEANYDSSVAVYGDSVTGDTPLLLRDINTGLICFKTIESLSNNWLPYNQFKFFDNDRSHKQQSSSNYEVWMDKGWSKIKRVIRHKTKKTIFKVVSNFGCVDVTEDHSLLDNNCVIIKPSNCTDDTILLQSYPKCDYISNIIPETEAFILGLLDSDKKLTNIDKILNSSISSKISYLDGFSSLYNGVIRSNYNNEIVGYKVYNKLLSSKLYFILHQVYKNVTIDVVTTSKKIIYHLLINNINATDNNIKQIIPMSNSLQTVYDLETSQGRFIAGIGQTIVKNTDSVFIKFNTSSVKNYNMEYERINKLTSISQEDYNYLNTLKSECIKESIEIGKIASKKATEALFKFPINLEYEKVYCPLLLLSKKRYVGKLYSENHLIHDKMDNKGVVLTRRDNTNILKKTYQAIIDIIIEKGESGIPIAIEHITNTIFSIINNDIPIEDYIISKTLKENYKNNNIPHVVLASKLTQRDHGSAPKSNDRVPYIFIEDNSSKRMAQYKKVEDPEYAKKHNLKLDIIYYINSMKKSLSELLSLFIDNPEKIFEDLVKEYSKSIW